MESRRPPFLKHLARRARAAWPQPLSPSSFIEQPWFAPLAVGALLRVVAALTGFGWFAPDDYNFVVAQSGTWHADPSAAFTCDYRSTLLPRLFWLFSEAGARLGLHGPTGTLRFAYVVLGLLSATTIPAVHKLTARHADALTARTAAWLMAAYFLIPRISTRPLLETAAMVPLTWGALWLDRAREKRPDTWSSKRVSGARLSVLLLRDGTPPPLAAFYAALLLGLACMFRFQVGVLLPAVIILLARSPAARRATPWAGAFIGAAAVAALQAGLDVFEGRSPFSTPLNYLRYNLKFAHTFGESPWFTYVLHFLAFTLPPITLVLLLPMVRSMRRHVTVATLLSVFVLCHSFIGHKEDRFMFPVLPLFFVLLASGLEGVLRRSGWHAWAGRLFWVVNGIALVVATCSDAQRNLTRPFLHIARQGGSPSIATVGLNLVPQYYLHGHGTVDAFDGVDALRMAVAERGAHFDYILLRHPNDARDAAIAELSCGEPELFFGDWLDRVLVRVNRHNERRDATALITCGHLVAGEVRWPP